MVGGGGFGSAVEAVEAVEEVVVAAAALANILRDSALPTALPLRCLLLYLRSTYCSTCTLPTALPTALTTDLPLLYLLIYLHSTYCSTCPTSLLAKTPYYLLVTGYYSLPTYYSHVLAVADALQPTTH